MITARRFSIRKTSFLLLPFVAALSATAQTKTNSSASKASGARYIRSGTVAICIPDHGCTHETIHGQRYDVIETPTITVKAAVNRDHTYNRADVIIDNKSGIKLRLPLSDFRIEVMEPKMTRLSYVGPQNVHIQPAKGVKVKTILVDGRIPAPEGTLTSRVLAPEGAVDGHIFFEHSKVATSMALILPIGGYIFEFPFTAKPTLAAPDAEKEPAAPATVSASSPTTQPGEKTPVSTQ